MTTVFKKEVIDPNTGEIIQAVAFIPEYKDKDFAKIYKLFSKKLLEDLGTINGEAKLLFWLIAKTLELPIQSDLWIPVDYREVAKDLNTTERSIRRYFKKLLDLGYVEQFKPRNTTFRIKPEYLYKGVLSKYQNDQLEVLIRKDYERAEIIDMDLEE